MSKKKAFCTLSVIMLGFASWASNTSEYSDSASGAAFKNEENPQQELCLNIIQAIQEDKQKYIEKIETHKQATRDWIKYMKMVPSNHSLYSNVRLLHYEATEKEQRQYENLMKGHYKKGHENLCFATQPTHPLCADLLQYLTQDLPINDTSIYIQKSDEFHTNCI